MKKYIIAMVLIGLLFACTNKGENIIMNETITISGQVTDFDGNPIGNSNVFLNYKDFTPAYEALSDKNGYYKLENVAKGRYMSFYALKLKKYPRNNAVPEEDMRLEYWAWNVIAEENLTINPRYERLELYGTNVFKVHNHFFVYFRPMSLAKVLSYQKNILMDKDLAESLGVDISVKPEYLDVKIYANDEPLNIFSITPIEENDGGNMSITGYIVQVASPEKISDKPYIAFRVEAENKEDNEKGENIYFYEILNYK